MLESILPGLDLMMIGMSIVFSFLLLLIIATKLMSLIVGSVFDDTSIINKVDTNGHWYQLYLLLKCHQKQILQSNSLVLLQL